MEGRLQNSQGCDEPPINYLQISCKVGVGTLLFPVEKAKTLMQMGYEPLPMFRTRSFFGKPMLGLPNVFKYMQYMWRQGGFSGLYDGWSVHVLYQLSQAVVYEHTVHALESPEERQLRELDEKRLTLCQRRRLFVLSTARDLTGRLLCIVATQPLFVLQARVVAQFVGDETQYCGWLSGLFSIYQESGLSGFLSGLCPRLIAGAVTTVFVSTVIYATSGHSNCDVTSTDVVTQSLCSVRPYTAPVASFVVSTLVYPCQVVATCTAVSGANLVAGSAPLMPHYSSWWQCWRQLRSRGQLKRGASLLTRYYSGPQVVLGGKVMAID